MSEKKTRNRISAVEAVRQYYLTHDERHARQLTPTQEEIRQRLVMAHALILKKGTMEATIRMMVRKFRISDKQARRDIVEAINLFGDVSKAEKEGWRYILFEKSMQVFQIALRQSDVKGMNAAIKNAKELMGLNNEDMDIPDFERIKPSLNVLVLPTNIEQALAGMLSGGAVNLNRTIDITPEPVTDEEE